MNILGIDFGLKKIGLSLGNTSTRFAEPLSVIRYGNQKESIEKIIKIAKENGIENIVIGLSEGKSEELARLFGESLKNESGMGVEYQDETLTTFEAQKKSIEAGINRRNRQKKEDAFAATLILQSYLDSL